MHFAYLKLYITDNYKDQICRCNEHDPELSWSYDTLSQKFHVNITNLPRYARVVEVFIHDNITRDPTESMSKV